MRLLWTATARCDSSAPTLSQGAIHGRPLAKFARSSLQYLEMCVPLRCSTPNGLLEGSQGARSAGRSGAMVLPFELLRTASNQPMMVELKNGETSRRAPSSSGQNRPRLGRKDWRCL